MDLSASAEVIVQPQIFQRHVLYRETHCESSIGWRRVTPEHLVDEGSLIVLARETRVVVDTAYNGWNEHIVRSGFFNVGLVDGDSDVLHERDIFWEKRRYYVFKSFLSEQLNHVAKFLLLFDWINAAVCWEGRCIWEYVDGWGMPNVFEGKSKRQYCSIRLKLETSDDSNIEPYPRTFGHFELFHGSISGALCGLGRVLQRWELVVHHLPLPLRISRVNHAGYGYGQRQQEHSSFRNSNSQEPFLESRPAGYVMMGLAVLGMFCSLGTALVRFCGTNYGKMGVGGFLIGGLPCWLSIFLIHYGLDLSDPRAPISFGNKQR